MVSDYVEALLLWTEKGPSPVAAEWMERHGLSVIPMAAGLLIRGSRQQFEAAFQVDLSQVQTPFYLPVPTELRDVAAAIGIPGERTIHARLDTGQSKKGEAHDEFDPPP